MEEKELNLCDLLKGCEGERFYSRAYGEVTLNEIVIDDRPCSQEIKVYTPDPQSDRLWFLRDGRKHKNGEIDLYPSRQLCMKYPLDAYAAWMEWAESRKPKRWRAKKGDEYWYIDGIIHPCQGKEDMIRTDYTRYKIGNYFRTREEAQQAAEEVRKTLIKFHEHYQKK